MSNMLQSASSADTSVIIQQCCVCHEELLISISVNNEIVTQTCWLYGKNAQQRFAMLTQDPLAPLTLQARESVDIYLASSLRGFKITLHILLILN